MQKVREDFNCCSYFKLDIQYALHVMTAEILRNSSKAATMHCNHFQIEQLLHLWVILARSRTDANNETLFPEEHIFHWRTSKHNVIHLKYINSPAEKFPHLGSTILILSDISATITMSFGVVIVTIEIIRSWKLCGYIFFSRMVPTKPFTHMFARATMFPQATHVTFCHHTQLHFQ